MSKAASEAISIRHYFVDEAGDGTLFNGKGQLIIGTPGCSRFFFLGLLDVENPEQLTRDLETRRRKLLADPYLNRIYSMQPNVGKTAVVFHATDDVPEVRREVFALLLQHPLRFLAVVRDKDKVVEYVRQRNQTDAKYRYNPNELYDYMVRRLFKTRLHKGSGYNIYFAKRGKSDRTAALDGALATARQRFSERWGINSNAPINVIPAIPKEHGGLQAVDYFLWALQRLYEKGDDRYVPYLWDKISLVHDIDDTRTTRYGVYYTRKKPLTLAALRKDQGI